MLGRKDDSNLVDNDTCGIDVPLLFPYLVPTLFRTLVLIHLK
jgi:hypothetical protein